MLSIARTKQASGSKRLAESGKRVGWNGLLIGDMSQPRGGPMLNGHSSHQIGLDVDIWFTPMPDHELSPEERDVIDRDLIRGEHYGQRS